MHFQRETLYEVIEEVQPLLDAHYTELTRHKEIVKLAPKWDAYASLEQAGMFVIFTAREFSQLAGYNAFFIQGHMHYAELMVAQNDVFWLEPEYRKGTAALRFLRYCERALNEMGAKKIVYHCKASNNMAPILHRMGYQDEEVMTAKLLGA